MSLSSFLRDEIGRRLSKIPEIPEGEICANGELSLPELAITLPRTEQAIQTFVTATEAE
jgi:hypothetical protein